MADPVWAKRRWDAGRSRTFQLSVAPNDRVAVVRGDGELFLVLHGIPKRRHSGQRISFRSFRAADIKQAANSRPCDPTSELFFGRADRKKQNSLGSPVPGQMPPVRKQLAATHRCHNAPTHVSRCGSWILTVVVHVSSSNRFPGHFRSRVVCTYRVCAPTTASPSSVWQR